MGRPAQIITIMQFWLLDMVQDIGWLKIPGEVTLVKMVTSKSKVVLDIVDSAGKSIVYQSVKKYNGKIALNLNKNKHSFKKKRKKKKIPSKKKKKKKKKS